MSLAAHPMKIGAIDVAKKKDIRGVVKLRSTASGHVYITQKNRRNDPQRLELRKYDPLVCRHILYREAK